MIQTRLSRRGGRKPDSRPSTRRIVHVAAVLLLSSLTSVQADLIVLRGGEKLVGALVSESPEIVIIDSINLGRIEVRRERIERWERLAPSPSNPGPVVPQMDSNSEDRVANAPTSAGRAYFPWEADTPGGDSFDWIQLKSGEWLKGKIKSLQDDKLEFDSDKLNALTFNWKDIYTTRSPRRQSLRLEGIPPIDGSLLVTTNRVSVTTSSGTNSYPRAGLLAITPTGNREWDKWTGKLAMGVSFRTGNTRETDIDVHLTLSRRTPDTRLGLDYLGNYTKVNGSESANNQRFIGKLDAFLSRHLYLRVPDLEYYHDPLQNLTHRVTVGAGVGYDLISTPRTEWNVTAGPAWQDNWFESVAADQPPSAASVTLVLSSRFDIKLTPQIDYIIEYRGQVTSAQGGNNTHHAVSTLEFELHKRLKLDLSFTWDRITTPMTEASGDKPTPDDFRLTTSLAVEY